MCSSGHNSAAKMHPKCLAAFCIVEIKCKVLNVLSLSALMEIKVFFRTSLYAPVKVCLQFDEVSNKNTNVIQGIMSLDGVDTSK